MTKLKTLKDMTEKYVDNSKILVKELKAEAVKDIKIIKEAMKNKEDLDFLHKPTGEEFMAIKSYIIFKNDLTEEDLKENHDYKDERRLNHGKQN